MTIFNIIILRPCATSVFVSGVLVFLFLVCLCCLVAGECVFYVLAYGDCAVC